MRTSHLFSAVALAAALTAATTSVYAGAATTEVGAGSQRLSIPQIHDKLEAAGYHDIRAIELEREGYEVKAVDLAGQRVKLYLDPVTGEVLEVNKKRDKREMDARNDAQEDSRFAD